MLSEKLVEPADALELDELAAPTTFSVCNIK